MSVGVFVRTEEYKEKCREKYREGNLFIPSRKGTTYSLSFKRKESGKRSESLKENAKTNSGYGTKGKKFSEQSKEKMKVAHKKNFELGLEIPLGRSRGKVKWYTSPFAGRIYLRSSYELIVAEAHDKWKDGWKYEDIRVQYTGEDGEKHTWFVDFHILGKQEHCIECKGFVTETDILKWKAFREQYPHIPLLIVTEEELWMFEGKDE